MKRVYVGAGASMFRHGLWRPVFTHSEGGFQALTLELVEDEILSLPLASLLELWWDQWQAGTEGGSRQTGSLSRARRVMKGRLFRRTNHTEQSLPCTMLVSRPVGIPFTLVTSVTEELEFESPWLMWKCLLYEGLGKRCEAFARPTSNNERKRTKLLYIGPQWPEIETMEWGQKKILCHWLTFPPGRSVLVLKEGRLEENGLLLQAKALDLFYKSIELGEEHPDL